MHRLTQLTPLTQFIDRQRRAAMCEGQSLVLFAALLPLLAGMTGLVVDAGNLYFQRRHLQSLADAAALTGAQVANFNPKAPQILADGVTQATTNAQTNGAQLSEIIVHLPPSAGAGAHAGKVDYIEVILTRSVRNPFMALFGIPSTTLQARAVSRCIKPGYGTPAVLALAEGPDAITFNGGSSSAVNIVGDVVSHGGIDPNGNASHFQITGAAYAHLYPAPPNLTTTTGNYGTTSGVGFMDVPDPIEQGLHAQPPTIVWPNFATMSSGTARICDDPFSGNNCNPDPPGASTRTGSFSVGSSKYAKFTPGSYGDITIRGHAEFAPGEYSFNSLDLASQAYVTDNDQGVLFHIRGAGGLQMDVSGGAEIHLTAKPVNTWSDIVFYVPNGDIDLTGNGEREINGTVYAPNGSIEISGNGGDFIVNGQVIGETVHFSGNGPAVSYNGAGAAGTFGPILVNVPD